MLSALTNLTSLSVLTVAGKTHSVSDDFIPSTLTKLRVLVFDGQKDAFNILVH